MGISPELFRCPDCHGALRRSPNSPKLVCERCGPAADVLAANLLDFLGARPSPAERILGWPADGMREAEDGLVALRRGEAVDFSRLGALGFVAPDGRPTRLGEEAAYHAAEFAWQSAYDPLEGLLVPPPLAESSRVLDLGCGCGQTLRRLFPSCDATLVGVDCALDMLAIGSSLFETLDLPAIFCCASAHALPFPDATFDFVVCRTAINYTQQARAVAEGLPRRAAGRSDFFSGRELAVGPQRAAAPEGSPPLHVRSAFARCRRASCAHWLAAMPGGVFKGPRAYVSQRRFREMVGRSGGDLMRWNRAGAGRSSWAAGRRMSCSAASSRP